MKRDLSLFSFGAAVLCLFVLTGCQSTPQVEKVHATPTFPDGKPLENEAKAVPGTKLKLGEVTGETKDGEKFEGELQPNEDYKVEVKGGTFDPETMEIKLSDDPKEVPPEGYVIRITTLSTGEVSEYRLQPDFARLHGPAAEEIGSMDAKLLWSEGDQKYEIPQGTYLIPGEEYELSVSVEDSEGRKFNIESSDYPIPMDRLGIQAIGLQQVDKTTTFRAAQVPPGSAYSLDISYDGSEAQQDTLTYAYDEAISEGPSGQDVNRITILGELNDTDKIKPGDVKTLEVTVSDTRGRSWKLGMEGLGSHASREFPLPGHRLRVDVENGVYDPSTFKVNFEQDAKSMLKKTFNIVVSYIADEDETILIDGIELEPDFLGIVPLLEKNDLIYVGNFGQNGQSGHKGRDGSRGNDMQAIMGRGGDGRSGGHGTAGQHGARGIAGPNIRVVAREVRTLDAATRLVLFEIRIPGRSPEYYIRELEGDPTTIISKGGQGGDGGDGGGGGKGGDGGKAYFSGHGGDGGDAGPGGDGGDGGNGGSIDLVLATYDLEPIFITDSIGGTGGNGGEAGSSGQPGIPGAIGEFNAEDKDLKDLTPPQMGSYGNEGNIGYRGRKGHDGMMGDVSNRVDEAQAAAMVRRAPASLRDVILY